MANWPRFPVKREQLDTLSRLSPQGQHSDLGLSHLQCESLLNHTRCSLPTRQRKGARQTTQGHPNLNQKPFLKICQLLPINTHNMAPITTPSPQIDPSDNPRSSSEYGSSGPCLGTVWADTDNPVYSIEINETKESKGPG